ncbi:MAG: mechanosensitive ion channel, partial [Gemmatimonadota bacterium]
ALTIVVFVVFTYLIKSVTWLLDTLAERSAKRRLFYKKLAPIVRLVLWVFAAYLVVRVIFQVDARGVIAAAAAVGVAVGFAAQDLLKNLFGGQILVFDQPFQVGDKISVGGTYGEVVSIGLRSTRMVTPDDNLVSVPNAQVVDGQVANANAGELNCQVVTDLYLPGWVDESVAKKIAFQAAASSKYVYLNKPIVVLVKDEFKETFLTRIRVKAYVLDPRHEFSFQSDVTERARAGFREAGLVHEGYGLRALVEVSGRREQGEAERGS